MDELAQQLRQADTPTAKERLQVLYWLKQANAPNISVIAKAVRKHRNTVQSWLSMYRDRGVEAMLEIKQSPFFQQPISTGNPSSGGTVGFTVGATR